MCQTLIEVLHATNWMFTTTYEINAILSSIRPTGITRHSEITKPALGHTLVCMLGSALRHLARAFLHLAPTHCVLMPTLVPAAPADPCSSSFLALPPRQQAVRLCRAPKCVLGCRRFHRTVLSASVFPRGLVFSSMEAAAPVASCPVPWRAWHREVLRCVHRWASWWRMSQVSVT